MSLTPAERTELLALGDACVQCGLCLPHCPTYADTRVETESPRGRILLGKAIASGRLEPAEADEALALSHCLGCRACERACPARVDYGRILELTRQALRAQQPVPRWQRALEALLARPRALRVACAMGRLLQRLPPVRRRLPELPPARRLAPEHPALGPLRGRLALLQGCVASEWETAAHAVALRLLTRLGWAVRVLPPGCCGALHRHSGNRTQAEALAGRLRSELDACGAGAVLHAGSGCHAAIRAAAGGLPVHELCSFIAADERLAELAFRPSSLRVAVHVACTQRNVVGDESAERRLLARIPGLRLCAPSPPGCCGAAGVQALRFPGQAGQRMQALHRWYRDEAPDRLLAGNLGCRLHLARALGGGDATLSIAHPLSFLDEHLQ